MFHLNHHLSSHLYDVVYCVPAVTGQARGIMKMSKTAPRAVVDVDTYFLTRTLTSAGDSVNR